MVYPHQVHRGRLFSVIKMLSYTVVFQILLGVAGLTRAQSPQNVFPQVNNALVVQFSGQQVQAGSTLPSSGLLQMRSWPYEDQANQPQFLKPFRRLVFSSSKSFRAVLNT